MIRSSRFHSVIAACAVAIITVVDTVAATATGICRMAGYAVFTVVSHALALAARPDAAATRPLPQARQGLTARERHDIDHIPLEHARCLPAWRMCPSC